VHKRADELGRVRAVIKNLDRLLREHLVARELSGAEAFLELLAAIPAPDPSTRENQFRNEVIEIFQDMSKLAIRTQREVPVPHCSSKLDLFAHFDGHDYLVTFKRGFNHQKRKLVEGEIDELRRAWSPRVPGTRVFCILYAFGVQRGANQDALTAFDQFCAVSNAAHGRRFHVARASPLVAARTRSR
jgi:hypothetical protein